jgi:hypothetical protein
MKVKGVRTKVEWDGAWSVVFLMMSLLADEQKNNVVGV